MNLKKKISDRFFFLHPYTLGFRFLHYMVHQKSNFATAQKSAYGLFYSPTAITLVARSTLKKHEKKSSNTPGVFHLLFNPHSFALLSSIFSSRISIIHAQQMAQQIFYFHGYSSLFPFLLFSFST